jgi:hypothetical protein
VPEFDAIIAAADRVAHTCGAGGDRRRAGRREANSVRQFDGVATQDRSRRWAPPVPVLKRIRAGKDAGAVLHVTVERDTARTVDAPTTWRCARHGGFGARSTR